jgi:hypothetical protein
LHDHARRYANIEVKLRLSAGRGADVPVWKETEGSPSSLKKRSKNLLPMVSGMSFKGVNQPRHPCCAGAIICVALKFHKLVLDANTQLALTVFKRVAM